MNCIYCGTPLSDIDYCTGCGADITILKRVARISNLLYNEGLDKARVRDLSGAIKSLKRSLEFNKEIKMQEIFWDWSILSQVRLYLH